MSGGCQELGIPKNLPANAGDPDWIPGSGRSPGEGNSNPLQYSGLENPMDRGAWQGYSPRGSLVGYSPYYPHANSSVCGEFSVRISVLQNEKHSGDWLHSHGDRLETAELSI